MHEVLEAIAADGYPIHWIYGNNDNRASEQWANLTGAEGGLHGTVANLRGIHVAGLGGTYVGRAWYPRRGDEVPAFMTRGEWLQATPRNERRQAVSVTHEDVRLD